MNNITPDQEVDQPYLTDLLRKALDRPALKINDWKAQPIHGGMDWDSAVYRFQGNLREAGETFPWSLILKTINPTEKSGDPGGIWYWKRDALAYQSGLLHELPKPAVKPLALNMGIQSGRLCEPDLRLHFIEYYRIIST
jgi:hypothetical protein